MTASGRAPDPAAPAGPPADGMVWVPDATFIMGSDRHYPEETPAHPVTVPESGRHFVNVLEKGAPRNESKRTTR